MPNSYSSWRTGVQIDNFYPVGSIYFSVNATNPHELFGGTWEALGGKFLIGADANYIAGSEGGSASSSHTHTMEHIHTTDATTTGGTAITIAQMPAHNHTQSGHSHGMGNIWSNGSGSADAYMFSGNRTRMTRYTDTQTPGINNTGGGQAHTHSQVATTSNGASNSTTSEASNTDNLPPYLVVYIWKRIA